MRASRLMGILSSSMVLLACRGESRPASPVPGMHRVRAPRAEAGALAAQGAVILADYDAFLVLDAPAEALQAIGDAPGVELRDDDLRIHLNSGDLDTSSPQAAALSAAAAKDASTPSLRLVQFVGPVQPAWRAHLEERGLRVVAYVPNNAFLVYGPPASTDDLRRRLAGALQFQAPYTAALKVDASLAGREPGVYALQLIEDPAVNAETLALAASLASAPPRVQHALGYVDLELEAGSSAVLALAARPDVVSVLEGFRPRLLDERQDMILAGPLAAGGPAGPGYLEWLAQKGFTQEQFDASGFGVDVSDSGIDNGTDLPEHFGLYRGGDPTSTSRVAYNRLEGTPSLASTLQGCDGHGTLNAHVVGGHATAIGAPFADAQGFRYGLGVAPFVRLGSSVVFDPVYTRPVYEDLQSRAYAAGMRISTNSWGGDPTRYDANSQRYDALVRDAQPAGSAAPAPGNQEMVIVFAAGNAGPEAGTLGSPGNAKNVISVGAAEGVQPFGQADGCGLTDSSADSAMDVAWFSSRGPAMDGRMRPDLMAPGTHISGGVAQAPGQRGPPPAVATGKALACFDASGVCATASSRFFPANQEWYTVSSGTSHATPAVAGAGALVRQWFLNQGLAAPSPAMTKAFLVSSARYMTGDGAGDALFSGNQGMGLVDLGAAFDGTPRLLRDEDPADLFTSSGETRTFTGSVGDESKPFRVTLAWTDAPGSTLGAPWVNDLDLTVDVGGQVYRGNVFSGATSAPGGAADPRNNLESVFLPAGTAGPFTVTVTAANIAGDGVPGNASGLDQDFALVVVNRCDLPVPPTPSGLTVAPSGDNVLSISWAPVPGASGYQVYRAGTAAGPFTRIATAPAPPFLDGGRSGGVTYFYEVRTANGCALSAPAAASAAAIGPCVDPPAFAGLARAASTGAVTCGIQLAWAPAAPSCAGALTYDVHRGPPGFTPSDANRIATGLAGTGFVDSGSLAPGTGYAYVVRAVETVPGQGARTDANAVERVARPTFTGGGFRDDFDGDRPVAPEDWWQERVVAGLDALRLVSGCHYQSATTAYRFGAPGSACGGTYANGTVNRLVLGGDGSGSASGVYVPPGATLGFRLWYALEAGYDAAWLEYSTTGPDGTFQLVPTGATPGSPYISAGGYDGTGYFVDHGIWSGWHGGANGSLQQVTVNLDAVAGRTVWFAWVFLADSSSTSEGVYLDDVSLTATGGACSTAPVPAGPPVGFRLLGIPPSVTAGTPLTVSLQALDANGQVATGYDGAASLTSTDPAAALPASVVFHGGLASAQLQLRTTGSWMVTASDALAPAVRGSTGTTVTVGPPSALRFDGRSASGTAGQPLWALVSVVDACGNRTRSTAAVALSVGAGPAGATLTGTTTVPAVAGQAQFSVSLDRAGAGYTLVATSPGLAAAESPPFSIAAAAPARLLVSAQPARAVAGEPLAPALTIALADAFGNLAGGNADVQLAIGDGPPGATLGGTASASTRAGVATFDAAWLDLAGTYTLVASAVGLESATTDALAVVAAAPDRIRFVQQPPGGRVGMPLEPAIVGALQDRFGNLCADATGIGVTLLLDGSGPEGTLLGDTTATTVDGLATFPEVALDRTGAFTLVLAVSAPPSLDGSGVLDVEPGPVARYRLSAPAQAAAGAEVPMQAAAVDGEGAVVPRYRGRARVVASDPLAQVPAELLPLVDGESGPFSVIFPRPGTYQVTVQDAGGSGVEGSATIQVAGPPSPGGGGGCDTGGGSGVSALLGVLALVRRRWTRRARARPAAA